MAAPAAPISSHPTLRRLARLRGRRVTIEVGAGARSGRGACLLAGVRVEPGASVPPNTVLQ